MNVTYRLQWQLKKLANTKHRVELMRLFFKVNWTELQKNNFSFHWFLDIVLSIFG